jgi:hypothetical protein
MVNHINILLELYKEVKFWLPLLIGVWTIFKGYNWFISLKDNDLKHIQDSVNNLQQGLDNQTTKVVESIEGMRSELRTYFAPSVRSKKR